MSQYSTEAQFTALGLPGAAFADLGSPRLVAALVAASGVIDSYLRKRKTLPMVSWEEDLQRACQHIAAWDLMCFRGFNPANPSDQAVVKRYDDCINWLRDVAKGLVEIGGVDSTPELDEEGTLAYSAPLRLRLGYPTCDSEDIV
jgi:phage gp36-like protein